MPNIKTIFSRLVMILAERGELELSKDFYINGSTIHSRATQHRIKWCSNVERFGATAYADILE